MPLPIFLTMSKGAIHIGTSGWSYKHWKGIYYPGKLAAVKWLSYYAGEFKITEINSSFYHLPGPSTPLKWLEQVPADFIFCPKMSRYLTQYKKLNEPEEPLERFFEIFEPMRERMGPVLVQLPASLPFHDQKAEYFFNLLNTKYSHYKFALEIRHESWLEQDALALMKKYKIAFVISQSGGEFPYAEHVTARHVYVRFHGPQQLYASPYGDEQLNYFAKLFLAWKKEGRSIYVFFNNDISGYAITDARKLIGLVSK